MTSLGTHPLDPLYEGGDNANMEDDLAQGDLSRVLPALAGLMRETISRFEDTAGRVSDLVIQQREQANLDLIVALQDFDRLQQEFSALGDALFRYIAATDPATVPGNALDGDVIGGILLDDVKQRLLRRIKTNTPLPTAEGFVDEQEF